MTNPPYLHSKNSRKVDLREVFTTQLPPHSSQPKAFTQKNMFQRSLFLAGIPFSVVPASLWWVLESPLLAQSEAICVLLQCHKLALSHEEKYPWTPFSRSRFFPVELSKFENIISLEGIVFVQCFWQRLLPSQDSKDYCSDFRHSLDLSCCRFGHFTSEAFNKEFLCLVRFASCHRDLLRFLVNKLWSHSRTLLHIIYREPYTCH